MTNNYRADGVDRRLLRALAHAPRATAMALADRVGLSRNTVHARLGRLEAADVFRSPERTIDPAVLGYPMKAVIFAKVTQRKLDGVASELSTIAEVLEVLGVSGEFDLLIHVVTRDADDLYRVAGRILHVEGIKKTTTALIMRELVDYRIEPLIAQLE